MTSPQRRKLKTWVKFRDKPMSIAALFWASRRVYLLIFIGLSFIGWLAYTSFGWLGVAFVVVAFITAILRDLGYFIRSARVWPVIRQTIDWSKVERLLNADGAATPEA
jgi:hypothetical protein